MVRDYKVICDVLSAIRDNALTLDANEFMPTLFWQAFDDILTFASAVNNGWAEVTDEGKRVLDVLWEHLSDERGTDPDGQYKDALDWFRQQSEDAEIIPIERGIKNA